MSKEVEYKDLIAFHPGTYVEEIIEDLNITQAEFAERLGVSPKMISKITSGEDNISVPTANKLAKITGISIQTWLNLQANYDAKVAEIADTKNDDEKQVCECIDFSYLKRNGFVESKNYLAKEKIQELRKLLKLSNLSQLFSFNASVSYRRASAKNESKSIVCSNVMLELATNMARNATTTKYSKKKLEKALPVIREMSVKKPEEFFSQLKDLLLDCGIVLEALPHLKGARLNGATKKFRNGSILLLITDKNKFSDIFWFSLIHELGHIYYEDFYSDYDDKEKYQEKEAKADAFASKFFVPIDKYEIFVDKGIFTDKSIKVFAQEVNISTGIVVGRLQSDKLIDYRHFNYLKSKYEVSFSEYESNEA